MNRDTGETADPTASDCSCTMLTGLDVRKFTLATAVPEKMRSLCSQRLPGTSQSVLYLRSVPKTQLVQHVRDGICLDPPLQSTHSERWDSFVMKMEMESHGGLKVTIRQTVTLMILVQ